MAMTNVYTGSNGVLTLANESSPEGDHAKAVTDTYQTLTVGRVSEVRVRVDTLLEEFHEVGRRHPVSLHPGNVSISGTVGRAYVNGALLFLLLGRGAAAMFVACAQVHAATLVSRNGRICARNSSVSCAPSAAIRHRTRPSG